VNPRCLLKHQGTYEIVDDSRSAMANPNSSPAAKMLPCCTAMIGLTNKSAKRHVNGERT